MRRCCSPGNWRSHVAVPARQSTVTLARENLVVVPANEVWTKAHKMITVLVLVNARSILRWTTPLSEEVVMSIPRACFAISLEDKQGVVDAPWQGTECTLDIQPPVVFTALFG